MLSYLRFLALSLAVIALSGCDQDSDSEAVIAQETPAATGAPQTPPKAPHAKYSLQWLSNDIPTTMTAGKATLVHVSVKNMGNWPWRNAAAANPSKPDGSYAVRLSYRWASADGKLSPQGSERGELTTTIPPGETANLTMEVIPPKEPGSYRLEVDLVEELVAFFSAKGNEKLIVPVTVQ